MKFLAVHAGAGSFKENVEAACSSAIKASTTNEECQCQLVKAIMHLESWPSLNCGIGSNLTDAGTVECEAAFTCSDNLAFGAVATVTNCINPICAAHHLASAYQTNAAPNGLIEPIILVGIGAEELCKSISVGIVQSNEELKTKTSRRDYRMAKNIISSSIEMNDDHSGSDVRLDTVGGVSIDLETGLAEAATSSGGIMLKKPGRVGHSAHFGTGIWAERRATISIAISLSGCGEAIIRTQLAEKLAEHLFSCDLEDPLLMEQIKTFLERNFLHSARLSTFPRDRLVLAGLLLIKSDQSTASLIAFHNSDHFPFAFVGRNKNVCKFKSANERGAAVFVYTSFNL